MFIPSVEMDITGEWCAKHDIPDANDLFALWLSSALAGNDPYLPGLWIKYSRQSRLILELLQELLKGRMSAAKDAEFGIADDLDVVRRANCIEANWRVPIVYCRSDRAIGDGLEAAMVLVGCVSSETRILDLDDLPDPVSWRGFDGCINGNAKESLADAAFQLCDMIDERNSLNNKIDSLRNRVTSILKDKMIISGKQFDRDYDLVLNASNNAQLIEKIKRFNTGE